MERKTKSSQLIYDDNFHAKQHKEQSRKENFSSFDLYAFCGKY